MGAIPGYYQHLQGTHFVKDLWYYDTKILDAFPWKNMAWSDHNFANAITTSLQWHVQIFDFIRWSESKLEQEDYSDDYHYGLINSLQNKILNLPDQSTILPKFLYGTKGKLARPTQVLLVRVRGPALILKLNITGSSLGCQTLIHLWHVYNEDHTKITMTIQPWMAPFQTSSGPLCHVYQVESSHVAACWWAMEARCYHIWVLWDGVQRWMALQPAMVNCLISLDKMATILQTAFTNAFSWMKSLVFWFQFHWSLFLRVRLTISHHWFR